MATDIATLAIKVDAMDARLAAAQLATLEKQGDKTEKATNRLGASMKKAAFAAALMTAAATALAISYSIKKAMEFESAISDLSAITGATGKDLEFLAKKSKEFGATTTLSATQAAEAFKLMASSKPDLLENGEALAAVTKEAISLAEAAGIQLPEAANVLGNSLNQFGADASEASRFINVLAAGSKFGAGSIESISQAMINAGGAASVMGLSFEETNAVLQVMAANGLRGAEAGTALKSILAKLEKQNNDTFKPSIVGVAEAFENMRAAGLSNTEQIKLFGEEMFAKGTIIIQSASDLQTLTDKLTGTGTAYEQAATKTDNLEGDLKRLSSVVEALAIAIGEKFIPMLRSLTQGFTDLIAAEVKGLEGLDLFLDSMKIAPESLGGMNIKLSELHEELARLEKDLSKAENGDTISSFLFGDKEVQSIINDIDKVAESMQKIEDAKDALSTKSKSGKVDSTPKATDVVDVGQTESVKVSDEVEKVISIQQAKYERLAEMALEADATDEERLLLRLDFDLEQMEAERQRLIDQKTWTDDLDEQFAQAQIDRAQITATQLGKIIDKDNADKRKAQTASAKFTLAVQQGEIGGVLKGLTTMTAGLAKHNRAAFEMNKAAATGQVIISGIKAISAAAEIGFPQNIPGIIFETVSAAGRLAAVQSASFGGGGSIPTSQGGSAGGVPSQQIPVAPAPTSPANDDKPTSTDVSVSLGDEDALISVSAVRGLIDRINDQIDDGVVIRSIKVA